mmetsp:Transcript_63486/g.105846  ORF Transcript_63486/g.105846 Transcript_63486/m.105846 type:complete len:339 (+) Transcript_63486:2415-3431(+)
MLLAVSLRAFWRMSSTSCLCGSFSSFRSFFHLLPAVHQLLDGLRKDATVQAALPLQHHLRRIGILGSTGLQCLARITHQYTFRGDRGLTVGTIRQELCALHCCKAHIVLLDDGGVQGVEVQQQHIICVQTPLGVQHLPTSIFGLSTPTCCPAPFLILFIPLGLVPALRLVWHNEFLRMKPVQQQKFNPLSPRPCEGAGPQIAGEAGQPLRQGDDGHFVHEPQRQHRLCVTPVHQFEDPLGSGQLLHRVQQWLLLNHRLRDLAGGPLKPLSHCQPQQLVGRLLQVLTRQQVRVRHQASIQDCTLLPRGLAHPSGTGLQPRHLAQLHLPDARPIAHAVGL